ncbi:hypothetical protein H5410_037168 [Solanum commersonii]|uniref:Uncharacterized protein n=1 Tax=Solanum commersonii TaxID=4109 RepID=A0A9J5Y8R1_SOLCO|nr:hypothetical protein H5410_037168 [Solanum commersonii]
MEPTKMHKGERWRYRTNGVTGCNISQFEILVSFRKVNFTLGLGERRKEEKGEERSRFVEISLWISSGVIPTRNVRSHSIGLVHPCTKHV